MVPLPAGRAVEGESEAGGGSQSPNSSVIAAVSCGAGKANDYLEVDPGPLRGYTSFRNLIGSTAADPYPMLNYEFDITEKTWAAYAMSTFRNPSGVRFDGNVGVRVIGTDVTANGFKRVDRGAYTPITENGSYTDVLPSLNTRWFIQEDFFVRFALSRQLSRQPFSRLNPNLRLTPPGTPGQRGTGTAGNPDLDPLRTDQVDSSLERYFNETTNVYASYYHKKIDGYPQRVTTVEEYDGVEYDVGRYQQVDNAKVQGFEFGYQQFFTFLPEPFDGLGLLANCTYVDAKDPVGLPLTNLSENSCNLILMYEKRGLTARLAYNWRDTFARSNSTNAGAIGSVPNYDKAFDWLDASISYEVNEHFRVGFDVSNALRAHRESYYRDPVFQHEDVLEDRLYYINLTWKLRGRFIAANRLFSGESIVGEGGGPVPGRRRGAPAGNECLRGPFHVVLTRPLRPIPAARPGPAARRASGLDEGRPPSRLCLAVRSCVRIHGDDSGNG